MRIKPFREGDTSTSFRNLLEKVTQEIQGLENEYVLKASPVELEQYYLNKVKIEPINLQSADYYIENQKGTKIDVNGDFLRAVSIGERAGVQGTRLDIAIPYEGDSLLWKLRPSTFSYSPYPELEVRDDVIVFAVVFPDDSADTVRLKSEIDNAIGSLSSAVQNILRDVEGHNSTAEQRIRSALQAKRKLADSATEAVMALGIPMKRRDKPETFTIPTKRRPSPVSRPKVPSQSYKPDPALDEAEYQHILNVMRSMSSVIERSPAAFSTLDEEAIRTHFLFQLNGHYEGGATGETFNASGKTDILIRVGDKNVFISECKFWRGPKAFKDAVDQLMGYLSWRDSKCALLIFNKTKNSSDVRKKMHEAMEGQSAHRRTVHHDPDGDSRYIFVKKTDPGKEIIITTQLYDVPTIE